MLVSPYTPGDRPKRLAGRSEDLQAIRDYLAPVLAYGEKANAQMILHGPRGVGKTSLMGAAADDAQRRGFVVAWTSCRRGEPFLADMAHAIDRELQRADTWRRSGRRWTRYVDKVGLELALPTVAKLSAELKRGDHPDPPPGAVSAVEDLLQEAARASAGADSHGKGAGLIVAIDELHAGSLGELAVLLNANQNLNRDRTGTPLAILGAGIDATLGTLTTAATFGERSRWREVRELTVPALAEALTAPAEDLGVTWHPRAVEMVLEASHRYPHFLQIMGDAVWSHARPAAGGFTISADDARAGIKMGDTQILSMYRARWGSLTEAEQNVVAAIASLGGDDPVGRADVEAQVGQRISVYRERLLDKAIIEAPDRGKLQFTLPMFADFVRQQRDSTSTTRSAGSRTDRPAIPPPPAGGATPPQRHFLPAEGHSRPGWTP